MACHPRCTTLGTWLPGSLCNLRMLLPHPIWAEKDKANPCKHVQLCAAHNCHRHKHWHRHGLPHMAKNPCRHYGLCRSICCEPQQGCKIEYRTPHLHRQSSQLSAHRLCLVLKRCVPARSGSEQPEKQLGAAEDDIKKWRAPLWDTPLCIKCF